MMHDPAMPLGPARFAGDLVEHARALTILFSEIDAPGPGAFERAARKLRVDPSVLRRRVAALEEFVGGPLLRGRGAELAPTPLGARARGDAARLLAAAEALRSGVRPAPRVVVGCTEAIASELMPDVLVAMRRRAAVVALRRVGTEACVARLLSGEVDVGVVRGSLHDADRWPRSLQPTWLGKDRLWAACPRASAPARAPRIVAKALARTPLVLYGPASATRARVLATLGPLGGSVALEVEGRAAAIAYARRGFGVGFLSLLPRHVPRAAGVVFRDVTRLFAPSGFWLLVRDGDGASPAARQLAALTVAHARAPRRLLLTES
jgi:DNA-binding transcriptional LysR family regulator